jgi:hypothetical protein
MAKTETATESKVHPRVRSLADTLKAEITVDKKTGTSTPSADYLEKTLPEGLTVDHIKATFDHVQDLVAAGTLALGELSTPVMKKDESLTRTSLVLPLTGKNHIGVVFDRTREVRAPGSDTPVTKYGSSTQEVVIYGAKNRGELAKVKDELADLAMAAFKK